MNAANYYTSSVPYKHNNFPDRQQCTNRRQTCRPDESVAERLRHVQEEYSKYADAFKETKQIMCTLERKQWHGESKGKSVRTVLHGTTQHRLRQDGVGGEYTAMPTEIENMLGPSYVGDEWMNRHVCCSERQSSVWPVCIVSERRTRHPVWVAPKSLPVKDVERSTPLAVIMFGCWQMGSFAYTIEDIW